MKATNKMKRKMTVTKYLLIALVLLVATACNKDAAEVKPLSDSTDTTVKTTKGFFSFDDVAAGSLPKGWVVGNKETWEMVVDTTAPSGGKALAMTTSEASFFGGGFNLVWTDNVSFLNGELEVSFKADSGDIDQGGGLMWRVQDKDNYYVARFNPLEDNLRVYYVKDGSRRMIESSSITLSEGWHKMKISQKGNHFEAYLDGKRIIQGSSDVFNQSGGIGLWTKADAVTSFDDLSVNSLEM